MDVERRDRNLIRAREPATGRAANIKTFKTKAEAAEFHSQLEVAADRAGKRVAVYFVEQPPADLMMAVRTCLHPNLVARQEPKEPD